MLRKNNTDIWGEINPPEFIELDIKPVTSQCLEYTSTRKKYDWLISH
jgi:hypothetical protein